MSITVQAFPERSTKSSRTLRIPKTQPIDDAIEDIVDSFDIDCGHLYELGGIGGKKVKSSLDKWPVKSKLIGTYPINVGDSWSLHYDFGADHYFSINVIDVSDDLPADPNHSEVISEQRDTAKYDKLKAKAKNEAPAGAAGHNGIYIFGGFSGSKNPMLADVMVFEPSSKPRKLCPLPPGNETDYRGEYIIGNDGFVATLYNNKVYTLGGQLEYQADCYNISTNTWETNVIPNPNNWNQQMNTLYAGVVGDKMYVMGAVDYRKNRVQTCFAYDFIAKTWTRLQDFPHTRNDACAVVVGDKIYLIGGRDKTDMDAYMFSSLNRGEQMIAPNHYKTTLVYDTTTNQYSTDSVAPMSLPRVNFGAAYADGYIYVTGGDVPLDLNPRFDRSSIPSGKGKKKALEDAKYVASAEKYNISTNTWEAIAPIGSGPRALHVSQAYKGKIYLIGGGTTKLQKNCDVYDISTNTWSEGFTLPKGRFSFPSICIDNPVSEPSTTTTTTTTTTTSSSSSRKRKST